MASYAALVSLQHIIEKIQHHHASHLKSLSDNPLIEALRIRASSLQDFIEGYESPRPGGPDHEEIIKDLEIRIADAAYAAEDVLETRVVDRIRVVYSIEEENKKKKWLKFLHDKVWIRRATDASANLEEDGSLDLLDQNLEKVIKDMDLIIEKDLKKIKKDEAIKDEGPTIGSSVLPTSSSSPSTPLLGTGKNAMHMVGFDEYLKQVLEMLTGQGLNRQIIPIFGMGGIGKTTLAKNIYVHPFIVHYFELCAWATISQEYSAQEILSNILREIGVSVNQLSGRDDELGEILHKELYGRRYLIILDDMWSIEAWDEVKMYFPDNNKGSRVMVTTRISNLAPDLGSSNLKIEFLDDVRSWKLFCQKVFGEEGYCSKHELEEVGKMITKKCKGLPLSIVTIGGLLAKSRKTLEYWEHVLENLNSIITLDGNEFCLKVLSLSYSHLPVHLKPCFLYMGVFPEDYEIRVSRLIRLWVAEGFLKPNKAKSLEEVAEDCLHDLIDRNLISVQDWGSRGKIRTCTMHDLLRELCMKEAKNEKFLYISNLAYDVRSLRLFAVRDNTKHIIRGLESASLLRSVTCNFTQDLPFRISRLLRVLNGLDDQFYLQNAVELFNSRYLRTYIDWRIKVVPSSINLLWNLQTVYIRGSKSVINLPIEIWKMPQLRHIKVYVLGVLPHPPSDADNISVLENIQTVSTLMNFKINEEIARRIPNIKKLKVECNTRGKWTILEKRTSCCTCLNNLDLFHKLEVLSLSLYYCGHSKDYSLSKYVAFPLSLKKLHLSGSYLPWESITSIGTLPKLEVLELWGNAFYGDKWNAVEGEFRSLKFLEICSSGSPRYWIADETCFPRLESLELRDVYELVEIPSGIGEIPTLRSIYVDKHNRSVFFSAKRILEEQRSYENNTFQVLTEDGPISLDDE